MKGNDSERGLYNKYKILDCETGEEKQGSYFVLNPEKDPAAISALKRYVEMTPNRQLASDIENWLEAMEMMGVKQPTTCDYCGDEVRETKGSPFMADVSAKMCERCWNDTRKEYIASNGEDIGPFKKERIP
jgi:hypothetical protein